MQRVVLFESFYRLDLAPIRLECEQRARLHRLTVEQHSAGATIGGVAADVRSGQVEVFSQKMNQEKARLDIGGVFFAIDRYAYGRVCDRFQRHRPARSTARRSARRVNSRTMARL